MVDPNDTDYLMIPDGKYMSMAEVRYIEDAKDSLRKDSREGSTRSASLDPEKARWVYLPPSGHAPDVPGQGSSSPLQAEGAAGGGPARAGGLRARHELVHCEGNRHYGPDHPERPRHRLLACGLDQLELECKALPRMLCCGLKMQAGLPPRPRLIERQCCAFGMRDNLCFCNR